MTEDPVMRMIVRQQAENVLYYGLQDTAEWATAAIDVLKAGMHDADSYAKLRDLNAKIRGRAALGLGALNIMDPAGASGAELSDAERAVIKELDGASEEPAEKAPEHECDLTEAFRRHSRRNKKHMAELTDRITELEKEIEAINTAIDLLIRPAVLQPNQTYFIGDRILRLT